MNLTADELMRQASMTSNTYLDAAIDGIDLRFGTGYAKAHPELVSAHMQSAAIDFLAGFLGQQIQHLTYEIGHIGAAIGSLEPNKL